MPGRARARGVDADDLRHPHPAALVGVELASRPFSGIRDDLAPGAWPRLERAIRPIGTSSAGWSCSGASRMLGSDASVLGILGLEAFRRRDAIVIGGGGVLGVLRLEAARG